MIRPPLRRGAADHQKLASIAVERTRMPMVITDPRQPDNPIVMANKAFLDLTGYTAEEVVGSNCRFLQGPGTSLAAVASIRAALAEERDFEIEILNYRKDGSAFWNQLNLRPVHDDDGQLVYVFASQIDITALRKVQSLEATEHRLLMEVDHRSRNVLAVVDGIVRLSRSDDAALYASAIQQRVQALAHAHALLAERGWREVPLEQIVRPHIRRFGPDRVAADGPEVMVSAFIVQPLSLVLHELASNAASHGALSAPAGRLTLNWSGGPDTGGFTLRWEEVGGPPPPPAPRRGFGAMMLEGMIERQLQGRLERDWRETGLVLTMSLPGALAARKVAS
jgi:PAS domain S-box-containing protein